MDFYIKLTGHDKIYPLENIVKSVFRNAELYFSEEKDNKIISELTDNKVLTTIILDGKTYYGECSFDSGHPLLKKIESVLKLSFINAAEQITKINLPWGILTGIRPSKMVCDLRKENYSDEYIRKIFKEDLKVSESKTELMFQAAEYEEATAKNTKSTDISVYIGIPFCPSRCAYCSFISKTYKNDSIINDYLDALIKEIETVSEILKNKALNVKTIYVGGGTPTTLNAVQLEKMLFHINSKLDLSHLEEFTVECGRPDTITEEKLSVLSKYKVDRISINPQTLNNDTLKAIGRSHSVEDFFTAYNSAKKFGFKAINTDLIAGLPGESLEDFKFTLDKITELSPENITVHTLSVKRAAKMIDSKFDIITEKTEADKMLDYANTKLKDNNYEPYYLYRQKNTLNNLENTGYTKKGSACAYNIIIMQEIGSIISLGGGGVNKIIFPKTNEIKRLRNPKDGDEYIKNIENIIKKKYDFFEQAGEIFDN
ncbi:MAG: coproporphyrinogen dehydrogenase HemZ [Clostridia bacterium]|nr:coproporphyrinogen dehydrogenase HemZ [Clostridia bacterium]